MRPQTAEQVNAIRAVAQSAAGSVASTVWPVERIELSQMVWGECNVGPETVQMLPDCMPALGMDPSMTVVEVGTGLGGLSRMMHLSTGVYVLGFEADPALIEAARLSAMRWGLRRKTRFSAWNPADPDLPGIRDRSVDRLIIHATLTGLPDLAAFMERATAVLKDDGQILLADLFVSAGAEKGPHAKKWRSAQSGRRHLWSMEEAVAMLEAAGVEIHVQADLSAPYCQTISAAWADYLQQVTTGEHSVKSLGPALKESAQWMATQKAIKAGALQYRRISGTMRR